MNLLLIWAFLILGGFSGVLFYNLKLKKPKKMDLLDQFNANNPDKPNPKTSDGTIVKNHGRSDGVGPEFVDPFDGFEGGLVLVVALIAGFVILMWWLGSH